MNWFTESYFGGVSLQRKETLLQEHGGCSHVEEDVQKLAYVMYENDAWGREGHCVCEGCHEKSHKEKDDQEEVCYDCQGVFRSGDMKAWKPYDFNPRKGDRYLHICKDFQTKPKHLDRVKRDKEDMEIWR